MIYYKFGNAASTLKICKTYEKILYFSQFFHKIIEFYTDFVNNKHSKNCNSIYQSYNTKSSQNLQPFYKTKLQLVMKKLPML